jgi:hypothetical protein
MTEQDILRKLCSTLYAGSLFRRFALLRFLNAEFKTTEYTERSVTFSRLSALRTNRIIIVCVRQALSALRAKELIFSNDISAFRTGLYRFELLDLFFDFLTL